MNKKDVKRIEEIFNRRQENLVSLVGELALEFKHEIITEDEYEKEVEEIDGLINILHYLKLEILEG